MRTDQEPPRCEQAQISYLSVFAIDNIVINCARWQNVMMQPQNRQVLQQLHHQRQGSRCMVLHAHSAG